MTHIDIEIFERPSGSVAGFATLFSPSAKRSRVAHAYLMADGSVDLSTSKTNHLSLEDLKSHLSQLAEFERRIRQMEWSNHPAEQF